jgi:reticulon-4-interacting protein 1, mitochondrial
MYTILLAQKRGWKVLSTCSGRNVDFVKSMGAEDVVDFTQQNVREHVKAFKPDAIIDYVGGTECLGIANRYVTIVGDKAGKTKMGASMILTIPRMLLRWLWGRFGYGPRYGCITLDQKREYLEEAKDVLDAESIVVDSTFAFGGAKAAFERLETRRVRGNVIVEIT